MTDQLLQPRGKAARVDPSRPRYVVLWERIQQLEAKLLDQESINDAILRQFSKTIRPLEEHITTELRGLTQDVMRRFHESEDNAHRSLLGFWILDNFEVLAAHPFANETEVMDLYDEWRLPIQGTDDMVEAQLSLLMASRDDLPGQSRMKSNYPDVDMFAAKSAKSSNASSNVSSNVSSNASHNASRNASQKAARKATSTSAASEHAAGTASSDAPPTVGGDSSGAQAGTNDPFSDDGSRDDARQTGAGRKSSRRAGKKSKGASARISRENLDALFDIDTLFRRIANAVHPDRELDEGKKAEKHAIMSECLEARENDDIARLLSLYAEHVGGLPTTWSDESSVALVEVLEAQLADLERRASNLHNNDPVLQMILGRYLAYDTKEVNRRINAHMETLTLRLEQLRLQRRHLKTEEGFEDALADRRDIELDRLTLSGLTR